MSRTGLALSIVVLFSTASASAGDLPARKPGLWGITIAGAHSLAVRQCSDAASDEAVFQAGIGLSGNCAKPEVQAAGDTITIVTACRSAGKTKISRIVITGSLESNYTMAMSRQAPARPMTLYAKWLGPCAANQKPGDVIMPDGTKINLLSAQRQNQARR